MEGNAPARLELVEMSLPNDLSAAAADARK